MSTGLFSFIGCSDNFSFLTASPQAGRRTYPSHQLAPCVISCSAPQHRRIWGAGRQVPSLPRCVGYGTVTPIQQRGWEPPEAPSLAEQAATAARKKTEHLLRGSAEEAPSGPLGAARRRQCLLVESTMLHALEASPVLPAKLESAARHKSAGAAAEDLAAQQGPLTC